MRCAHPSAAPRQERNAIIEAAASALKRWFCIGRMRFRNPKANAARACPASVGRHAGQCRDDFATSAGAELFDAGLPRRARHVRDRRDDRHRARPERHTRRAHGQLLQFGLARAAARALEPGAQRRLDAGLRAGSHYAINILAAEQHALAVRFAGKREDRFDGVAFLEGVNGAPGAGRRGRGVRMLQPQPLRRRRPRDLRRRGRALRAPRRRAAADLPRRPLLHRAAAVDRWLKPAG